MGINITIENAESIGGDVVHVGSGGPPVVGAKIASEEMASNMRVRVRRAKKIDGSVISAPAGSQLQADIRDVSKVRKHVVELRSHRVSAALENLQVQALARDLRLRVSKPKDIEGAIKSSTRASALVDQFGIAVLVETLKAIIFGST